MFKFDHHRNCWTRILYALHGIVVELLITPQGGMYGSWEDVAEERFFGHRNAPVLDEDQFEYQLPIGIEIRLVRGVGLDKAQRLAGHDYWKQFTPRQIFEACLLAGSITINQIPQVCEIQPIKQYPEPPNRHSSRNRIFTATVLA